MVPLILTSKIQIQLFFSINYVFYLSWLPIYCLMIFNINYYEFKSLIERCEILFSFVFNPIKKIICFIQHYVILLGNEKSDIIYN